MKRTIFTKVITSILLIQFIVTSAVQAAPLNAYTVSVPEENGRITQRYKSITPVSDKLIIHIRDAHTNLDAQVNMAKIICSLLPELKKSGIITHPGLSTTSPSAKATEDKTLGSFSKVEPLKRGLLSGTKLQAPDPLPFIGIEGAYIEYDLNDLRQIPLKESREIVGKDFVRDGSFLGAEYANMIADEDFTLVGLEDKELFEKNFRAFYSVQKKEEKYKSAFAQLAARIRLLKKTVLNERLRECDRLFDQYMQGEEEDAFLTFLLTAMAEYDIDVAAYPHLAEWRDIVLESAKCGVGSAESEDEAKAGTITHPALSGTSPSAKATEDKTLRTFSKVEPLKRGLLNNARLNSLDYHALSADIDAVTLRVKTLLAETQEEKELVALDTDVDSLLKMVSLTLTKRQIETVRAEAKPISIERIVKQVEGLSKKYNLGRNGMACTVSDSDLMRDVDAFYGFADTRDEVMVDTLLRKMDEKGQRVGILVAGGYHSDGIARILKERNISFVTVTPNMRKHVNDVAFDRRMMGQIAPIHQALTNPLNFSRLTASIVAINGTNELKTIEKAAAIQVKGNALLDSETGMLLSPAEVKARLQAAGKRMPSSKMLMSSLYQVAAELEKIAAEAQDEALTVEEIREKIIKKYDAYLNDQLPQRANVPLRLILGLGVKWEEKYAGYMEKVREVMAELLTPIEPLPVPVRQVVKALPVTESETPVETVPTPEPQPELQPEPQPESQPEPQAAASPAVEPSVSADVSPYNPFADIPTENDAALVDMYRAKPIKDASAKFRKKTHEYMRELMGVRGFFTGGYDYIRQLSWDEIYSLVEAAWKVNGALSPEEDAALKEKIRFELYVLVAGLIAKEVADPDGKIMLAYTQLAYGKNGSDGHNRFVRRELNGEYTALSAGSEQSAPYSMIIGERLMHALLYYYEKGDDRAVDVLTRMIFQSSEYFDKFGGIHFSYQNMENGSDTYGMSVAWDGKLRDICKRLLRNGPLTMYQKESDFHGFDKMITAALSEERLQKVFTDFYREQYERLGWDETKLRQVIADKIAKIRSQMTMEIVRDRGLLLQDSSLMSWQYRCSHYFLARRGYPAAQNGNGKEKTYVDPALQRALGSTIAEREKEEVRVFGIAESVLRDSLESAYKARKGKEPNIVTKTIRTLGIFLGIQEVITPKTIGTLLNPAQYELFIQCTEPVQAVLEKHDFVISRAMIAEIEAVIRNIALELHFTEEPGKRYSLSALLYRYMYKGQAMRFFSNGIVDVPGLDDLPTWPKVEQMTMPDSADAREKSAGIIAEYDLRHITDFLKRVRSDEAQLRALYDLHIAPRFRRDLCEDDKGHKDHIDRIIAKIENAAIILIKGHASFCCGTLTTHPGNKNKKLAFDRFTFGEYFVRALASGERLDAVQRFSPGMTNEEFMAVTLLEEAHHLIGRDLPHIHMFEFNELVAKDNAHDVRCKNKPHLRFTDEMWEMLRFTSHVAHSPAWMNALSKINYDIDSMLKRYAIYGAEEEQQAFDALRASLQKGGDSKTGETIKVESPKLLERDEVIAKIAEEWYREVRQITNIYGLEKSFYERECKKFIVSLVKANNAILSDEVKNEIVAFAAERVRVLLHNGERFEVYGNILSHLRDVYAGNRIWRNRRWMDTEASFFVAPETTSERGAAIRAAEVFLSSAREKAEIGRKAVAWMSMDELQHVFTHADHGKFKDNPFGTCVQHDTNIWTKHVRNILHSFLTNEKTVRYVTSNDELHELMDFWEDVVMDTKLMQAVFAEDLAFMWKDAYGWSDEEVNQKVRDPYIKYLQDKKNKLCFEIAVGRMSANDYNDDEVVLNQKGNRMLVTGAARVGKGHVYIPDPLGKGDSLVYELPIKSVLESQYMAAGYVSLPETLEDLLMELAHGAGENLRDKDKAMRMERDVKVAQCNTQIAQEKKTEVWVLADTLLREEKAAIAENMKALYNIMPVDQSVYEKSLAENADLHRNDFVFYIGAEEAVALSSAENAAMLRIYLGADPQSAGRLAGALGFERVYMFLKDKAMQGNELISTPQNPFTIGDVFTHITYIPEAMLQKLKQAMAIVERNMQIASAA